MLRFFCSPRKKNLPPLPPPSADGDEPADFEGTYPERYDHVVRVGVQLSTDEAPDLRVLLKSRSWPFREAAGRPEGPRSRDVCFTVQIPILGASLWAADEAASRLSDACVQARIGAHVVSTSRPRSTGTALMTYHVVPDVPAPFGPLRRRLHELLLRSRSRGTLRARSLAQAKEQLESFLEENPGAARDAADVKVTGPEGPVPGPAPSPLPTAREVLVLLLVATTACAGAAFALVFLLPDGSTSLVGLAFLAGTCTFGVYLLLRRLSEGSVNTWLPVAVTALFPVILIPAAHLNVYAYLSEFGISPGDVEISGYSLFLSGRDSAIIIFLTAVSALGLFGFLCHFHFGGMGFKSFVSWILAVGSVGLYTFLPIQFILNSSTSTGAEHVAHYRDGGAPVGQFGIVPTPVCVDEQSDIGDRFGPAPPTDRPVLHFIFANDIDFLWDPKNGVTKLPSFSVPLTPVADLESSCPAVQEDGASS